MSKHHDEQYRWSEDLRRSLVSNVNDAKHFRVTQECYLNKRKQIHSNATKNITNERKHYISGYVKAIEDIIFRELIHVHRIIGKPETQTSAKWDDMTEEMRQAYRDHNTESCLAWDDKGEYPYSEWRHE